MTVETLDELLALASAFFPYDQANYPDIDLSTPEKVKAFAIRHGLAHLAKSTGKIAAAVESADHGTPLDERELRINIAKAFMTVLNLAKNLGMTGEKLADLAISGARVNSG